MDRNTQQVINHFLATWKERPEYDGVLLSGSHAIGTANPNSDIDLKILYCEGTDFCEMGECIIGNQYVSFVARPEVEYIKYFQEDLQTVSKFEIQAVTVGQIIDDPNGKMAALQQKALQFEAKSIENYQPIPSLCERLNLNRQLKVLLEMPDEDIFFPLTYFELLQAILKFYAKSIQAEIPAFTKKWSRFFTQASYRKASQLPPFPDEYFVHLLLQATQHLSKTTIKILYDYVMEQTGVLPETNFMARFYLNKEEAGLFSLS